MLIRPLRAPVAAALAFIAVPASPQEAADPLMLDRLESGQWQLRGASGADLGSICLGDRLMLAQPFHRAAPCARHLLESNPRSATVRYSCRGGGSGRTTIRFETPRLVQIESQGLDQGAPFALRAEARRTGACQAKAAPERSPTAR